MSSCVCVCGVLCEYSPMSSPTFIDPRSIDIYKGEQVLLAFLIASSLYLQIITTGLDVFKKR